MTSRRWIGAATVFVAAMAAWGVVLYELRERPAVDLARHERSVFSPGGEDGILERIFEVVVPTNRFVVDLGAGDGIAASSSRNLIVNHGWRGLLIESGAEPAGRLVDNYAATDGVEGVHALIDPGDIEIILEAHGAPSDPDLLIIGLEANDWYVWRAIRDLRPRVVQIQYNAAFVPPQTMVIEYHPLNRWDGSLYFGASIQSLYNLARRKGYELVYANAGGTNLFFVESRLFDRFSIRDNRPLVLYRGSETLPTILPAGVRGLAGPGGYPLPPYEPELVVKDVRIPRTYVLGGFREEVSR